MSFLENKTAAERKEYPIASGVLAYFPDALAEVAPAGQKFDWMNNKDRRPDWTVPVETKEKRDNTTQEEFEARYK